MPLTQTLGHGALFQLHRDQKDGVFGLAVGYIEGEFDLLLHVTGFRCGVVRETDDYHVAVSYRPGNLLLPMLPRLQIFFVEPRVEAVTPQPVIKLTHRFFITGGVTEKYA